MQLLIYIKLYHMRVAMFFIEKDKQQKIKNFHRVFNEILFLLLKITEVKIMKSDEVQRFCYPEESFFKITRQLTKIITLPRCISKRIKFKDEMQDSLT